MGRAAAALKAQRTILLALVFGEWLVSAHDHGVDLINPDCEDCPEYGRHEEAADDIAYGMGLEEAWR
jgi:hypothetical protein